MEFHRRFVEVRVRKVGEDIVGSLTTRIDLTRASSVQPGPQVGSITDLDKICGWLGTYPERLKESRAFP